MSDSTQKFIQKLSDIEKNFNDNININDLNKQQLIEYCVGFALNNISNKEDNSKNGPIVLERLVDIIEPCSIVLNDFIKLEARQDEKLIKEFAKILLKELKENKIRLFNFPLRPLARFNGIVSVLRKHFKIPMKPKVKVNQHFENLGVKYGLDAQYLVDFFNSGEEYMLYLPDSKDCYYNDYSTKLSSILLTSYPDVNNFMIIERNELIESNGNVTDNLMDKESKNETEIKIMIEISPKIKQFASVLMESEPKLKNSKCLGFLEILEANGARTVIASVPGKQMVHYLNKIKRYDKMKFDDTVYVIAKSNLNLINFYVEKFPEFFQQNGRFSFDFRKRFVEKINFREKQCMERYSQEKNKENWFEENVVPSIRVNSSAKFFEHDLKMVKLRYDQYLNLDSESKKNFVPYNFAYDDQELELILDKFTQLLYPSETLSVFNLSKFRNIKTYYENFRNSVLQVAAARRSNDKDKIDEALEEFLKCENELENQIVPLANYIDTVCKGFENYFSVSFFLSRIHQLTVEPERIYSDIFMSQIQCAEDNSLYELNKLIVEKKNFQPIEIAWYALEWKKDVNEFQIKPLCEHCSVPGFGFKERCWAIIQKSYKDPQIRHDNLESTFESESTADEIEDIENKLKIT